MTEFCPKHLRETHSRGPSPGHSDKKNKCFVPVKIQLDDKYNYILNRKKTYTYGIKNVVQDKSYANMPNL